MAAIGNRTKARKRPIGKESDAEYERACGERWGTWCGVKREDGASVGDQSDSRNALKRSQKRCHDHYVCAFGDRSGSRLEHAIVLVAIV